MCARAILCVALTTLVVSCAPKIMPTPTLGAPTYPDFLEPEVPAALAESRAVLHHQRAWRFLQLGDLRSAEREVSAAQAASPAFYPADTTAGYVALARSDPKVALGHFGRALERRHDYGSALVGKGHALVALGRDDEAVGAFQDALAAGSSLPDLPRRLEVLRFRVAERAIAAAREAARGDRLDVARRAYEGAIASSPDSAFLYRELAALERRAGDRSAALEHLRRAVAFDRSDAGSVAQIAELLEEDGDLDGALRAYTDALALEANDAVSVRRAALLGRMELARLPAEYQSIDSTPELTRAQLAALIAIRLQSWVREMPVVEAGVITDVRGNWAEGWIMLVVRAGLMEAFANHTFQPATVVRRADLAPIADRLLSRLAPRELVKRWQSVQTVFADLTPGHLAYPAASTVVASGAMNKAPDGGFRPSEAVTGAEAVFLVDHVQRLTVRGGLVGGVR